MRTIAVGLDARAYEVRIGSGLLAGAGEALRPFLKRPRVAVVTDAHLAALHLGPLTDALTGAGIESHAIVLPPGEETKSFSELEKLCDALLALKLERGELIVALGGGVIGDLAGFAAAIFKRGIDFVQIPTSLLAQVDSSVGGKTAIDTPRGKNLIGAFHQPRLVLADLDVLDTLPDREMRCGYAEVIKYGLLGDARFFHWLRAHGAAVLARRGEALLEAVARCVEMKAEIVAEDEREAGRRALLNLGHTFGHAIEAETGFGEALKHGEAVAVGCAQAFRFSAHLGLCSPDAARTAADGIAEAGLPTRLAEIANTPFAADRLLDHMAQDKKAAGGDLTFILARDIGEAFTAKGVDPAAVRQFLIAEGAV